MNKVPKMNCQARVLNTAYTIPNTKLIYHTTTECGGEISKKLSIDSGDAYMNICSCCFRRYNAKGKPEWYGWFDGSYPPEAKVVGSKWYHEAMAARTQELEEPDIDLPIQNLRISEAEEAEPVEAEEAEPVEAEEEAEEVHVETKEEKKEALKARIKELQRTAKPGKMSLKEIQAAFKEITNLKTQIHML
jgi:hypothetical protein